MEELREDTPPLFVDQELPPPLSPRSSLQLLETVDHAQILSLLRGAVTASEAVAWPNDGQDPSADEGLAIALEAIQPRSKEDTKKVAATEKKTAGSAMSTTGGSSKNSGADEGEAGLSPLPDSSSDAVAFNVGAFGAGPSATMRGLAAPEATPESTGEVRGSPSKKARLVALDPRTEKEQGERKKEKVQAKQATQKERKVDGAQSEEVPMRPVQKKHWYLEEPFLNPQQEAKRIRAVKARVQRIRNQTKADLTGMELKVTRLTLLKVIRERDHYREMLAKHHLLPAEAQSHKGPDQTATTVTTVEAQATCSEAAQR